jgi:predicted DNA-binding transcriptional regulator YafY
VKKLDPLERRIEILKILQGREMRTGEIAEYFNVDERTIRTDIQELRDGIDILGLKIRIESKHAGNQKHYYTSNVHPIMLALNSSELYALLKLLEDAMMQSRGEVYKHIFEEVYSQITDYAEALIADKLKNKYDKTEITNLLEEEAFKLHNDLKLIYWEKSGRFIEISYRNEEAMTVNEKVKLINIRDNELEIIDEQENIRFLNYNDIVIDWTSVDYT